MKLLLLEKNRIITTKLPKEIKGNYWLTNEKTKKLVNVEAKEGKWYIYSNEEYKVWSGDNYTVDSIVNFQKEIELEPNTLYHITDTSNSYKLFCDNDFDSTLRQYKFSLENTTSIIVGNGSKTSLESSDSIDVNCNIESFARNQLKIYKKNDYFFVQNLNNRITLYVNDYECKNKKLNNGDIIFIEGLKICILGELIIVNMPNLVTLDGTKFFLRELPTMPATDFSNVKEEHVEFFKKDEYYQRPPRINQVIEPKDILIDPAPGSYMGEEMPMIFTMGTMLTMGTTTMFTLMNTITNITTGKATMKDSIPSFITTGAMVFGMLLMPLIRNFYTKNKKKKKERKRLIKYREYLKGKRQEIIDEIEHQRQVLVENNLSPESCAQIILNKERNLWERKLEHYDFLHVRVGLGTAKPKINVKAPEEHFSVEKDVLMEELHKTVNELKDMENVPIVVNLKERICSALVGDYAKTNSFVENIILQLITSQSYDLLKIVVFTNENNKSDWIKYQNIPYLWNNEKTMRFFGTNQNDIQEISAYLMDIYNSRLETIDPKNPESKPQNFKPYYLIITDSYEQLENVPIISAMLANKINIGFSLLINTDNVNMLPNECNQFINLDDGNYHIYEQEEIATRQTNFIPDANILNVEKCLTAIANIPIDIADGKFILPPSYGFLEMYDVGNVNQLNAINRWKENNIISSLKAPVGINEQGELFYLDIHEKYHGPHGLVAGMTGSGKSEWIITYILSMAINYHPDEVQFVLIDYKGGGLTGVFENRETGFKLPHLAGTITNLDVVEINRALASIQSELKRRQAMFNKARESLNESTIDIYKYQRLYREGKVSEPMSHLVIISDEFAELKAQQPEFMAQLISTARIGRSLGVHLILATQKPSGVVDDQIWSNAKFRACLKVQDKSDSNDMIKRPDAAMISEPGRFFLQVGYNEFFAKGQSAYAGSAYYESDKRQANVNTTLEFVDDIGYRYKTAQTEKNMKSAVHKGEELPNVLNYIKETADQVELHVKQLWLDRIPDVIFHDELKKKYNYQKQNFILNPILGEYDAPEIQSQGLLTLPLTKEGNTLIYGMSGSGKENLLLEVMYSLITNYTVQELNIFVLDFGAEILMAYRHAPQLSDILRSGDDEKIANLFKLLKNTLEERKDLFQDYNGDIYTYNTTSGKTVPNLVVIINNVENFQELYEAYQEDLVVLTRDGVKYGIIFICTTNGTNNIRIKLSQNFAKVLTLQLKDKYDYTSVLGNTEGTLPSKAKGRGLIKLGRVYEFQTAYIVDESKQIDYIKQLCQKYKEVMKDRAIKIPILPAVVNYDFIDDYISTASQVPIGVLKETLEVAKFDFLTKEGTLVVSQDSDLLTPYASSLYNVLKTINNLNTIIIDANSIFETAPTGAKYCNEHYDEFIETASKMIEKVNENSEKNILLMFCGISSLCEKITQESKDLLSNMLIKMSKSSAMNFIVVDSLAELKKVEYEAWYKEAINPSRGIYLGNGIDNQFTIKLSKVPRELRDEIPEDFGYAVLKGKAFLIKLINVKEGEISEQQ